MIASVLKYPGGKSRLMSQVLRPLVPPASVCPVVVDPFVGSGGAVLNMPEADARMFRLSDASPTTVRVLQSVLRRPLCRSDLFAAVPEELWAAPTRAAYERLRMEHPEPSAELAIWLNRAGFNGLHRVNSKGICNVPFGDGRPIPVDHVLDTARGMLRWAEHAEYLTICEADVFSTLSWLLSCSEPTIRETFLFLDPPYLGAYDGYTAGGFAPQLHENLRDCVVRLAQMGCKIMLTNSAVARGLYVRQPGLVVSTVGERTSVSAKDAGRKVAQTLLVTANLPDA